MNKSLLIPAGMLFLAALFWGLCIPVMKALGVEQNQLFGAGSLSSSLASLTVRFGLAGLIVAVAARVTPNRLTKAELFNGAVLGAITTVSMFLQVDGLNFTSASTAGFLIALYCVLVPVLSFALGRRRLTLILVACCLIVLIGLGVLTGVTPEAMHLGRGEWENIGAAVLFAVQIMWVGRLSPGACDPGRLTAVLCLTVSAFCLAALGLRHPGLETLVQIHASPLAMALTLFLAVLGTAAPFLIMNRFQPKVDPVLAGFIYCFEPIASAFGALLLPELLVRDPALYRNEPIFLRVWIGGGLILGANLLLLRDKAGPEPKKSGQDVPSAHG